MKIRDLCEMGINFRGEVDETAPHEVEVKYKGLRYIVRRGAIVELIYGTDKIHGTRGQRAEPTTLSLEDYNNILKLAKTHPIRVK